MLYTEVLFRGRYIRGERSRIERERLTAASFSAWQSLRYTVEKLPGWGKYVRDLGLIDDEPKTTKAELKKEAEQAMEKVQKMIDQARAKNGGG